jgi:tRNA threonylcarbamoyladenosine biosynthesis protein TsaB
MILYLDTTEPTVCLKILSDEGNELLIKKFDLSNRQTEQLIYKIEEILKLQNAHLSDIRALICVAGPGGFTSLRVGVTVANFLAFSLDKPVLAISKDQKITKKDLANLENQKFTPIFPVYSSKPTITKSKSGL